MTPKVAYLALYRRADEILKRPGNPCNIQAVGNGLFTCADYKVPNRELCCGGCKHLGPQGCTVQSLSCKLGWCYTNHSSITGQKVESHPVFVEVAKLLAEAKTQGIPLLWRKSYEETFKEKSHD